MSYHIISYRISYRIISCHIISYHIMSYHIISYHIISYHIISYHIISISYHIISYHIMSYHIISYHIIPFHRCTCFISFLMFSTSNLCFSIFMLIVSNVSCNVWTVCCSVDVCDMVRVVPVMSEPWVDGRIAGVDAEWDRDVVGRVVIRLDAWVSSCISFVSSRFNGLLGPEPKHVDITSHAGTSQWHYVPCSPPRPLHIFVSWSSNGYSLVET